MGNCLFQRRGAPPSSGPPKGKTLNEYTWEEISYISSNGLAEEYGFQAGDAKAITLNGTVGILTLNNYQTYAFIIGTNHNAALEGNNLIHFQIGKTALTDGVDITFVDDEYNNRGSSVAFRMNLTNSNSGGWEDSYMRNNICGTSLTSYSGTFINIIPADLRATLRPVTKYTDNVGGGSSIAANITTTIDYFFLPAEYEIFGSIEYANSYESNYQQQYSYYVSNSSTKYKHNSLNDSPRWSFRSPGRSTNNVVTGQASKIDSPVTSYANASRGLSPCFCV